MINDQQFAAQIAAQAGRILSKIQQDAPADMLGTPELKAQGDAQSQLFLAAELARVRPLDTVLSEEAADDLRRQSANRVWIIDPLDGTREFSEGRHDWAVHVALWQDGDLAAGAVALPGVDVVLTSEPAPREWIRPAKVRLAVSRSRATALVAALADELDAELVPMGSAGFKAGAVVRGEADAYIHSGGQYEWDSAAPVAVARAAGLFTSRIDGSPLEYNQENPYLPDLVICNPALADEILLRLKSLMERQSQ